MKRNCKGRQMKYLVRRFNFVFSDGFWNPALAREPFCSAHWRAREGNCWSLHVSSSFVLQMACFVPWGPIPSRFHIWMCSLVHWDLHWDENSVLSHDFTSTSHLAHSPFFVVHFCLLLTIIALEVFLRLLLTFLKLFHPEVLFLHILCIFPLYSAVCFLWLAQPDLSRDL